MSISRAIEAVREGAWLPRERLRNGMVAALFAYYGLFLAWALRGRGALDPVGHPVGGDFLGFYTVSGLCRSGRALAAYDAASLRAAELALLHPEMGQGHIAWFYPPTAFFLVHPLSTLPYLASYALAVGAGLAAVLWLSWKIGGTSTAVLVMASSPALFACVIHGQTTLPAAFLIGTGLYLLRRSPLVAGVLFGLACFKPQLGALLPFALLAGRHRRAFLAAAVTVLALAVASAAIYGASTWPAFLQASRGARAVFESGWVEYQKQASLFAMARWLGGSLAFATSLQALAALAATVAVVRVWARRSGPGLENAVLLCGTLLVSPFVLDYDHLLLTLAIVSLLPTWRTVAAGPLLPAAAALSWTAPIFTRHVDAPIIQLPTLLLFAALLARARDRRGMARVSSRPV